MSNVLDDAPTRNDATSSATFLRRPIAAAQIGRFLILREIGSGGMGVVYAAYDESLDRKVAIKLLITEEPLSSRAGGRLRREAQAMARIAHPNVVRIYEVGEFDGQLYVAMEYIDGVTLREWLARERRSWAEIIDVFIKAGFGLQAAHEAGVIHRDFKPDNVLIERFASGELGVKVLDFGLASVARGCADPPGGELERADRDYALSRLTKTGTLLGTPSYMSPEQFRRQATDPRSDQFSFAVALYEALYRERPFAGDSYATLRDAVLAGELRRPPPRTDVPTWAYETLSRALSLEPEARWESMAQLRAVLAHHPQRTVDPELDRTVALRQRVWMVSLLALSVAVLLAALVFVRASWGAGGIDEYAFWSKVTFAACVTIALIATKHLFVLNRFNLRVFALLLACGASTIVISIIARVIGLSATHTDQLLIANMATLFGQASASVDRWLLWLSALGAIGLLVSFAIPFVASITLGLCALCFACLGVYFWRRRPASHADGSLESLSRRSGERPGRSSERGWASGSSATDRVS